MNHLEKLISQYYEWQGYIVRSNVRVGRLAHGGWEGELDIVAYHPESKHLIHLESSIDANSWAIREKRFKKKFMAGQKFIPTDVFPWVQKNTKIEQVAVLITSSRPEVAGGTVISIDELVAKIKQEVQEQGVMAKNAIPEEFDLLRTIQYTISGYYGLK
jgi:hypothetical protein